MALSCVKLCFGIALILCVSLIVSLGQDVDSLDKLRSSGLHGKSARRSPGTLISRIRSRRTVNYEYAVVIDAGSSGSRVRVYRWPDRVGGKRVETSGIEVMQPQLKLSPGLSKHVENLTRVQEDIRNLIGNAKKHIPHKNIQRITPIYFMATAGMRQLHEEKMNDAVRFVDRLMRNQSFNPFSYKSATNSRILSGEEEGVFAWITVNYLLGAFSDDRRTNDTAGILEMGGASTQIAFNPTGNVLADKFPVNIGQRRYPLYVHSYLDYGQDNLVRWIKQHLYNETIKSTSSARKDRINDPCMFSGDTQNITGINATFIGTGNPEDCVKLLEILVYKVESWKCNPRPCAIGSFYQPTLPQNMTFYAVGAFIHTLTAINALNSRGVYIPAYGLRRAHEYCRKPYREIAGASEPKNEEFYRHDCLRGLYTYVLFTRGYGFANDTDKIIVSDKINEQSLDWALGAVLYENVIQECRPRHTADEPSSYSSQNGSPEATGEVLLLTSLLSLCCINFVSMYSSC